MKSSKPDTSFSRDLFTLARARMSELLAALLEERTLADRGGTVPPRSVQVSGLVIAEVVRLIRLGTRSEVVDAADELARTMLLPGLAKIKEQQPEAYRLVASASVVLGASTAPSSSGAELAVLRSFNGKARDAVAIVNRAPGEAVRRTELRARLGDVEESYLSHLLADLEACGLVVRIREGRAVTVHLGPTGRSEHVQEMLARKGPPPFESSRFEEGSFTLRLGTESIAPPNREAMDEPRLRESNLELPQLPDHEATSFVEATGSAWQFTNLKVHGRDSDNAAESLSSR